MDLDLRKKILDFLEEKFAKKLEKKIESGYKLKIFKVNPLTWIALSSGIFGELNSLNMARALIYPRVLGTSLTTSFGSSMQTLCVQILGARASGIPGMDIEFTDRVAGGEVFMQLKAGPNTINADNVGPMLRKMESAYRLMQQNRVSVMPIFAIGIVYGTIDEISANYKRLQESNVGAQQGVPIYIGRDLWHRITGDPNFYSELTSIFIELFENVNHSKSLDDAIDNLADEIEEKYFTDGSFDPRKI